MQRATFTRILEDSKVKNIGEMLAILGGGILRGFHRGGASGFMSLQVRDLLLRKARFRRRVKMRMLGRAAQRREAGGQGVILQEDAAFVSIICGHIPVAWLL
jgi:hypothetical protein